MSVPTTAVIDAAVLYGTARYIRDNYASQTTSHRKGDDRSLFLDFLHDLVLYDHLLLDNSSVGRIGGEIRDLFGLVNKAAGDATLEDRQLTSMYEEELYCIRTATCRLIAEHPAKGRLESIPVPRAYKTSAHVDAASMADMAKEYGISSLLPFALFAYRGICYLGFANGLSRNHGQDAIYLAAPGRLAVLREIISEEFLSTQKLARGAYQDLLERLPLPTSGYAFDTVFPSFMGNEVSLLAQWAHRHSPAVALKKVLELRNSESTRSIRAEWARRLWTPSGSSAVGSVILKTISNSTTARDVYMIHAVVAGDLNVTSHDKIVNIGAGATINAPVTVADTIQNSFNTLGESNASAEVKAATEELLKAVAEVSKSVPEGDAKKMAKNADALVKEVGSPEPDKAWYKVSLEGLMAAATNLGAVAEPVLTTVLKLAKLLSVAM